MNRGKESEEAGQFSPYFYPRAQEMHSCQLSVVLGD